MNLIKVLTFCLLVGTSVLGQSRYNYDRYYQKYGNNLNVDTRRTAPQRSYSSGGYNPLFANMKMGFRVAPIMTVNYVDGEGKYTGMLDNGASIQLSLGPTTDFFFGEKYSFTTGLFYTVKHVGFRTPSTFNDEVLKSVNTGLPIGSTAAVGSLNRTSEYNVQYLQLPLTYKLYSNELIQNGRIYIQFGGIADFKIAEKPIDRARNPMYLYNKNILGRTSAFNVADFNLMLAMGAEVNMGGGDYVYLGGFYNRGLTSTARDKDLVVKNSLFGVELGIKF